MRSIKERFSKTIIILKGGSVASQKNIITVPVYLPDRTIMGAAVVSSDGLKATVTIEDNGFLGLLLEKNIVAFSVMYYNTDHVDDILNEEKEKNDG